MRKHRLGSGLSPNEAATEQSEIERSVVVVRATMLLGFSRSFADLSAQDIRAIVCARFGVAIGDRSPDYIRGAFDALLDHCQPLPCHDAP